MKPEPLSGERSIPEIRVRDWDELLLHGAAATLRDPLRGFVATRRWYRSKARTVSGARVRDVVPVPGIDCAAVLLEMEYGEGEGEVYLVGVAVARDEEAARVNGEHPDAVIAAIAAGGGRGVLYDALRDRGFTSALLEAIAAGRSFPGASGELVCTRTAAFDKVAKGDVSRLEPRMSGAEQSNSAVSYGDRFLLKLFRKLESVVNPDFEIGSFLTERGFALTPAVAGGIEYRGNDRTRMSAGILFEFVPNRGDAWEYTIRKLSGFYGRASRAAHRRPVVDTQHPLDLMKTAPPAWAAELLGDYAESAGLLGKRTAEMHLALGSPGTGPEFAGEPFDRGYRHALHSQFSSQADRSLGFLRANLEALPKRAAEDARALLGLEVRIRERFRLILDKPVEAVRIRNHGDYHLGQVLFAGEDFRIIDFEGEPARPLEERRIKHPAMKDVAGMVRSFQYAAWSALLAHREREPAPAVSEAWADFWTAWAGATFARAYFETAGRAPFIPASEEQRKLLFDVFVLDKALYEVEYELNNRPDWVGIPLRGIAGLMSGPARPAAPAD